MYFLNKIGIESFNIVFKVELFWTARLAKDLSQIFQKRQLQNQVKFVKFVFAVLASKTLQTYSQNCSQTVF